MTAFTREYDRMQTNVELMSIIVTCIIFCWSESFGLDLKYLLINEFLVFLYWWSFFTKTNCIMYHTCKRLLTTSHLTCLREKIVNFVNLKILSVNVVIGKAIIYEGFYCEQFLVCFYVCIQYFKSVLCFKCHIQVINPLCKIWKINGIQNVPLFTENILEMINSLAKWCFEVLYVYINQHIQNLALSLQI